MNREGHKKITKSFDLRLSFVYLRVLRG